jgi:L-ascorbate metabolism protein UlaG (beta-lactamase superfamily)
MAEARVTYVGHATVLLELGGARLLTDPLLRSRVGPLRRQGPPPPPEVSRDLDAVLVSHLHHDHADLASLRRLGRDVRLLVPPGSCRFFERRRFTDVTELAPGETARVGAVTVTATEARHEVGHRRFAPASEPIGFLLDGPRRVYFAGDTDLFEGMAAWGPGLDLALLPIWGWGPNLGEGHLDPERAARAAALLAPKLAVPIHWGTLYPFGLARLRRGPLRSPPREFGEWVRKLAPQTEPLVLAPGETTSLA